MNIETYLKIIRSCFLVKNNKKSLEMSMNNVHAKDMFSLVIAGDEPGLLTRVFIAGKKLKPFKAQLHTHRYPLRLTVIKGVVTQHVAHVTDDNNDCFISMHEYRSPLNGGNGLTYIKDVHVLTKDFIIPVGGQLEMDEKSFHTISCSKGAMWIVEEMGFKTDVSYVLGVPFKTDGFYTKPEMFQINDKFQIALKAINKILNSYES